ncbi:hypothetical protein VIBR0546_08390 [Vibrio brasiliensis LMG 20546]|uniref:Uncharacterized protein n=1 Tax=Vibrio brasiliensis LMG 20546 TaxID=945543 RepID=E8LZT1_9VIBR|nr:hypothetical protein VIBR0546_08390 [Vibrio brasiliensis LMG 20546]
MIDVAMFLLLTTSITFVFRKVAGYEFPNNILRLAYCVFVFYPILLNYYSIFVSGYPFFKVLESIMPYYSNNDLISCLSLGVCIYSGFLIPKHPEESG